MALFNKETNILSLEGFGALLYVYDLNGNHLKSINPGGCLKQTYGICVGTFGFCVGIRKNGIEEIYVYDYIARSVFVFNQDFKLITRIGKSLEASYYLTIDCESDILYCSHRNKDIVTLWNVNDAKLIQELKIERPSSLRISENKIYIVSAGNYEADWGNRKFKKMEKGNYINVLNKSNHKIINKIQFDDWLDPQSLHLSSDGDIYTIAYELDKNNGIWSKNRFLFIIDSTSSQIKQKIELNDVYSFDDALYLNNKLILCNVNGKRNEIRIIEFEQNSSF